MEQRAMGRRGGLCHTFSPVDPGALESDHRVANSLSLTAALLRMQRERSTDDAVKSALQSAEARIASIANFHRYLHGHASDEVIELADYIRDVLPEIGAGLGIHCVLAVGCDAGMEVPATLARSLTIIVNELAVNALKHGYGGKAGGCMTVELDRDGEDRLTLKIADGGSGLPDGFDPASAGGLGIRIVHSLVRELGGTLSCHTDGGAQFTISIPAG